jgi:hypothetical protein
MNCTCGSKDFAKATVGLNISSNNPEDIQFFSNNKVVVVVCKSCKTVSWGIE